MRQNSERMLILSPVLATVSPMQQQGQVPLQSDEVPNSHEICMLTIRIKIKIILGWLLSQILKILARMTHVTSSWMTSRLRFIQIVANLLRSFTLMNTHHPAKLLSTTQLIQNHGNPLNKSQTNQLLLLIHQCIKTPAEFTLENSTDLENVWENAWMARTSGVWNFVLSNNVI